MIDAKEWIKPNYGRAAGGAAGTTLANVPATVAHLLGVPFSGLPPLPDGLWQPLLDNGPVRRVVLVLLDGLGANLVDPQRNPMAGLTTVSGTITSVCPSTTVNALSCLWTGAAPAQHGLVGVRLHFPEYGTVASMLSMSPNFTRAPDALLEAGLDPETFLAASGVGEQFGAAGVPVFSFKPADIIASALSRMHDRGCAGVFGAHSLADMLWQVGDLLTTRPGEPLYACAYWPSIDTLSHHYGMTHPAVGREVDALLQQIRAGLLEPLPPAAREGTVILVLADHGQMRIDPEKVVYLEDHPPLREALLLDGAGEPRMPYLYVRSGRLARVRQYVESLLTDYISLLPAETFLEDEWLGPHPHAPAVAGRVGDWVGLLRPGATFIPPVDRRLLTHMAGMHGGLSPDEMLVPFWGARLA